MSQINFKKLNQQGMSALLFAMIFVIILSLFAVGFASLVRNDQRQALDKTLSYQAQYAAESAINRKAAELQDLASGASSVQNTCQTLDLANGAVGSASATVTCITWTNEVADIQKDNLGLDPFVSLLQPKSGSFNTITIKWSSTNSNTYGDPSGNLPTIDNNKMSILRVAVGDAANIANTKVVYIVPYASGATSDLGSATNGKVLSADTCSAGLCTVELTGVSYASAWLSMVAYGPKANVSSIKVTGATDNTLVGGQAEIDANARAQDVTKRIKNRVSLVPQTWNPGMATSASDICKDIKVDGSQNSAASGATSAVCP